MPKFNQHQQFSFKPMSQNKRKRDDKMADSGKPEQPTGPFIAMFEGFRKELDEHHDRRERIIKASRDITASSKKM